MSFELPIGLLKLFPAETVLCISDNVNEVKDLLSNLSPDNVIFATPKPDMIDVARLDLPKTTKTSVHLEKLFSNKSEAVPVYEASFPYVSGVVPPSHFSPYWQNITQVEETEQDAILLSDFLKGLEVPPDRINWLIIDQFSAGDILAGSGDLLSTVEGVIVRTISGDAVAHPELEPSFSKTIEKKLAVDNFEFFDRYPLHYKNIGFDLYLKDWKKTYSERIDSVESDRDKNQEKITTLTEKLTLLEASQKALDALSRQHEEALKKHKRLEEAHTIDKEKIINNEKQLKQFEKKLALLDEAEQAFKMLSEKYSVAKQDYEKLENKYQLLEEVLKEREAEQQVNQDKDQSQYNQKSEDVIKELNKQTSALYALTKDVREVRQLQMISQNPEITEASDYWQQQADSYYFRKDYKRAAEYYYIMSVRDPNSAWAIQGLADSYARLDFKPDAQWFNQAHEKFLKTKGKWHLATNLYREALAKDSLISQNFNRQYPSSPLSGDDNFVENPIFVVGCGHSGTSILLRVLGAHPDIMPIPEESSIFMRPDQAIKEQALSWSKECYALGKSRWIEKTPPHIFQIERFLQLWPKAQFIIILRDGRDVVTSLKRRPQFGDVETRLDRWAYDNLAGLPYWKHPQVEVVKYEDFVSNTSKTLEYLCDFLNISKDVDLLDYHKDPEKWYSETIEKPETAETHSDHMQLRNWQINQPIYDDSGKWQGAMTQEEIEAFKQSKAQELLIDFGYVKDNKW